MQRIYIEENRNRLKNDRQPTHNIKLIPEDGAEDKEWIYIGALWASKSGGGWSGQFSEYASVTIDQEKLKEFKGRRKNQKTEPEGEIPF